MFLLDGAGKLEADQSELLSAGHGKALRNLFCNGGGESKLILQRFCGRAKGLTSHGVCVSVCVGGDSKGNGKNYTFIV